MAQDDEPRRPKVGVAILIWRDGKLLLTKRHGSHGHETWSIPGGHLEFNEDWEETARREAMEEVGCEIKNVRFVGVTNDIFTDDDKHYVSLWLEADWAANEPEIKEPHRILEITWGDLHNLPTPLFEPCWTNLRTLYPKIFQR